MVARNLLGDLALEDTQVEVRDLITQVRDALGPAATDETVASIVTTLTDMQSPSGALAISGTLYRFRDGFTSGTPSVPVDTAVWNLVNDAPDTGNGQGHIVVPGGDSQGSAYLRVSLSPFAAASGVQLSSKEAFPMPIRHAWGISASQRFQGQETIFGLAEGLDSEPTLGLNRIAQPADLTISGSITIASNVGTVTVPNHGLKGNDRVLLVGNSRKELNVGPVYVTPVDVNSFTVPITLANGTYTAGGVVRYADPLALAKNGATQIFGDNSTATNSSYATRRNGTKHRTLGNQTTASSAPSQINTLPYSDAWMATGPNEIWANLDEVVWRAWTDGVGNSSGYAKFQQSIPDEEAKYRLYCRARNLDNMSRPIARVTNITKTASTTVTVTTDVAHGLAVGDSISVTGVRDQTNFAQSNVTVVTVPSGTTFTAVLGVSATASDANGGVLWLSLGAVNSPGLITNGNIQSVSCTTAGVLIVTTNAAPSGPAIGDYVQLYGLLTGAARAYEGAYKMLRVSGSTMELAAPGVTPFGAITTGGSIIRRTDVRLHFARILGHTRQMVEVMGGRGSISDINNSVPVSIAASITQTVSADVRTGVNEVTNSTNLGVSATYTEATNDAGSGVNTRNSLARVVIQNTAGTVHGHLVLEESSDNSTFRETQRIPIPSDANYRTFDFALTARYSRFKFINGVTAQTAFYILIVRWRDESVAPLARNLQFALTPTAGQAAAGSATTTFPVLDLGPNPSWNAIRLWGNAEVAGTYYLDESMDGTTFLPIVSAGFAVTAGGAVRTEQTIVNRYLRVRHVNGAGAATAVKAAVSLVAA